GALGSLEVGDEVAPVALENLHQLPAVLAPLVEDLLGRMDDERNGHVLPLGHVGTLLVGWATWTSPRIRACGCTWSPARAARARRPWPPRWHWPSRLAVSAYSSSRSRAGRASPRSSTSPPSAPRSARSSPIPPVVSSSVWPSTRRVRCWSTSRSSTSS